MKNIVIETIQRIVEEQGITLTQPLVDDTVLLQSGLDSLSFAILVAELEEKLGYDPFVLMETPVYPRTLKEFVDIYEQYKSHAVG